MSARFEKTVSTLGESLSREVRQMGQRHLPRIDWVELLHLLIDRTTSRPSPSDGRFQRTEAGTQVPPVPRDKLAPVAEEEQPEAGRELSGLTREHLRQLLGRGAEELRVHEGSDADRFSRQNRADAVTVGRDVYFRKGRFQPEEPRGFALLAHEATHVVEAMTPGASWRRATQAGVAEEESRALAREQQLLTWQRQLPPAQERSAVAASTLEASTTSPVQRPMKAEADRAPVAPAAAPSQGPSMDEIRKTLYRDILNQIRVEFERGA